jgi:cobalt-zinc-cadmium efflux system outer membrane protein
VQSMLQSELTVDRAVQVALLNNRTLQAEFAELGVSQADLRQALLPRNPVLEGEVRRNGSGKPGELAVMQDVSSLLLTPLRHRVASTAYRQATLRAADHALELVADVRTAFFTVQAAEQVRTMFHANLTAAQAATDIARRQHEAGNISDLDLENQQVLYEEAKLELARSDVDVVVARERLNRLMGAWREQTAWTMGEALPALPDSERLLENLEAVAVANRLDLAAQEAQVRTARQAISLARLSQFPELQAGVHIEREPEGTRTIGPAVAISLPIFDRGQAAAGRARAELMQAEDRYAALAVDVRSEVRVAREQLTAASQVVGYYRDVLLPRRRRIVEQTQLEFNSMVAGIYQLLQARQGQLSAEREYIEAQRDYWIAWTELERALGGLYQPPTSQ